ncbi:MAG TPA: EamA family transporter [Bryobacteraceae bacterium]
MPKWLRYALLCIFWWGVFGFLSKIGSTKASPIQMQILFTIGMLPLVAAALLRRKIDRDRVGAAYGVLIGVLAGLGGIGYFAAMQAGKASLVGPVTSLFPLLTVLLAVGILKERMNKIQVAGVIVGLISIAVLSV